MFVIAADSFGSSCGLTRAIVGANEAHNDITQSRSNIGAKFTRTADLMTERSES
jgi:hypothetical protein